MTEGGKINKSQEYSVTSVAVLTRTTLLVPTDVTNSNSTFLL